MFIAAISWDRCSPIFRWFRVSIATRAKALNLYEEGLRGLKNRSPGLKSGAGTLVVLWWCESFGPRPQPICRQMGLTLEPVRFTGTNFNDIFDYLEHGTCDAVISGTTITPERSAIVLFSQPYLEFDQGVAVNRLLTPSVSAVAGLHGLTAGIQQGNTSDAVAKRWLAENAIAGIRYYLMTASGPHSTTSRRGASASSSNYFRFVLVGTNPAGVICRLPGANPRKARHRLREKQHHTVPGNGSSGADPANEWKVCPVAGALVSSTTLRKADDLERTTES
jgi:Bacterial extracellular solute-binding proteins, family 3